MLPGSTLLEDKADSISPMESPIMASLSLSGTYLYLPFQNSGHIHHGNFFKLLYPALNDRLGKLTQFKEGVLFRSSVSTVILQCQIQIEYRNIRCTRFDYLRAFRSFGR